MKGPRSSADLYEHVRWFLKEECDVCSRVNSNLIPIARVLTACTETQKVFHYADPRHDQMPFGEQFIIRDVEWTKSPVDSLTLILR